MKDALQQQHEAEQNGDMTIGPNGKPVMTPEALQRKTARDRAVAEEVSDGAGLASAGCRAPKERADVMQKARVRRARVEKLAENLKNKLAIFTEAAKGPDDKEVGAFFKVCVPIVSGSVAKS